MKIKLTSVYVDDQDKALRFYTEVLGFAKKADFRNGPFRWLTVASPEEPDGTELQLALNGPAVAVLNGQQAGPHQRRAQVARPAPGSQLAEHQQHEHQRVIALILGRGPLLRGQKQHRDAGDAEHDQLQPRKIHAAQHGKAAQHGHGRSCQQEKVPGLACEFELHCVPPARAVAQALCQKVKIFKLGILCGVIALLGVGLWALNHRRLTQSPSNTPASPATTERALTYSVAVQNTGTANRSDLPFSLAKEMLFESDYQIRLNISSQQSGFLYILNEGPHDKDTR